MQASCLCLGNNAGNKRMNGFHFNNIHPVSRCVGGGCGGGFFWGGTIRLSTLRQFSIQFLEINFRTDLENLHYFYSKPRHQKTKNQKHYPKNHNRLFRSNTTNPTVHRKNYYNNNNNNNSIDDQENKKKGIKSRTVRS